MQILLIRTTSKKAFGIDIVSTLVLSTKSQLSSLFQGLFLSVGSLSSYHYIIVVVVVFCYHCLCLLMYVFIVADDVCVRKCGNAPDVRNCTSPYVRVMNN